MEAESLYASELNLRVSHGERPGMGLRSPSITGYTRGPHPYVCV